MKNLRPLACITGSSSGIGAEYAKRYAAMGYDLYLIARREELLKNLCEKLSREHGISAHYSCIELSDCDAVKKLATTLSTMTNLEVLINNAGYGSGSSTFMGKSIEEHTNMLAVHNETPLRLMAAAIPLMIEKKKGIIINVASIAGFLVGSAMYCATKAFLINISETLSLELRGHGIIVQALCPGLTHTDFHQKLGWRTHDRRYKRFMSVGDTVDYSLRCIEKKSRIPICIPGLRNNIMVLAARLIPRAFFYALMQWGKEKIKTATSAE